MITAIVPIIGTYEETEVGVARMLESLKTFSPSDSGLRRVILAIGDPIWLRSYPLYELPEDLVTVVSVEDCYSLPSILCNAGLGLVNTTYVTFALPSFVHADWFQALRAAAKTIGDSPQSGIIATSTESVRGRLTLLANEQGSAVGQLPDSYQSGWIDSLNYLPMYATVFKTTLVQELNGFSTSPLLQSGAWWEWSRRSLESCTLSSYRWDSIPDLRSIDSIPHIKPIELSNDLVARRILRRNGAPTQLSTEVDWDDFSKIGMDLPSNSSQHASNIVPWTTDASHPCQSKLEWRRSKPNGYSSNEPLRVVILGGLYECAHNQLCFYNYFSVLEGQGFGTYRSLLDESATSMDLFHADLVIFSRVRTENGCKLMNFCNAQNIPTIYMLDDNWFAIGKEWPEYKDIFVPGAEIYERFIHCVRNATCVLTYNEVLAEDLRPHSKRVAMLSPNVDLEMFGSSKRSPNSRQVVGYVGSPRRESSAFKALCHLSKTREDFDILFMGAEIPQELREIPASRFRFEQYTFGYQRYARILGDCRPDILLAPIGNSRSESSRCPNKYLEATAAGAVGVYSNEMPYSQFIRDRVNGLLVENDSAAWGQAIVYLLDHPPEHAEILANARQDVEHRFDTRAVVPAFVKLFREVVQQNRKPTGVMSC